jgi:thioredoxin reductase (NADPH)
MSEPLYDVVIIGAGPAGLTAGLYASRAGLKSLMVERMIVGGQMMTTTKVENYPGFPGGIDGPELMQRFQEHCMEYGLESRIGEVTNLVDEGKTKLLTIDEEALRTRSVIIASGAEPSKLGLPREEELTGRGVSYCATCDGAFFRNVEVAVIGGGDTAAEEALFLSRFASKVYLIHRRDQLRATRILQDRLNANEKVEILWNKVIDTIEGDKTGLTGVKLKDTKNGVICNLPLAGMFVAIGVVPKAEFLTGVLTLDADGYIKAGEDCLTSMPGVFAAGDVRKKILKQVATAVGDGAVAAIMVEKYLDGI